MTPAGRHGGVRLQALAVDVTLPLPVLAGCTAALLAMGVPLAAALSRRARRRREAPGQGRGTVVWRVAKQLLWDSPHRLRAGLFALLLFVALAAANGTAVAQSYAQRDYMTALARRDVNLFRQGLVYALFLLAVGMPARCLAEFATGALTIAWRDALTDGLLAEYFKPQAVYWLRREVDIQDPDMRIAVEAGHFADAAVLMVRDIFENAFKLLGFIGVVYTVSGFLCMVMTAYAVVGALATVYFFGRPLVRLDRGIRAQEAAFRAVLARCRDKAEALAFAGGEAAEGRAARQRYQDLRRQQWSRVTWRTGLASFRDCFGWAAYLLPIGLVAPLWLEGTVEFGVVSQMVMAFQASLSALSVVIRKFRSVSALVAEGGRLEGLAQALGRAVAPDGAPSLCLEGSGLTVKDLSLWLPSGAPLCKDLSFSLQPGQRLLLSGESGTGKTTMLRALAGLWANGAGSVRRAASAVFLSQDPYIPAGALRRVLSFPAQEGTFADAEIMDAASRAQLNSVLERYSLNAVEDWEAVLSRGEQQRCAFCRVLLFRPELAVLDEATSALDAPREKALYEALEALCVVSVNHNPQMLARHTHLLRREAGKNGGTLDWTFEAV